MTAIITSSSTHRDRVAMSMCHKAYALDYESFAAELAPLLYRALETGRDNELAAFIDAHRHGLVLPCGSAPLPADWRTVLQRGDVHELGDLALTKYYDPVEDQGIQEYWLAVDEGLPTSLRPSLLGTPFGPTKNYFDPGFMGSYFQTSEMAVESRKSLLGRSEEELEMFIGLLEHVIQSDRGLYVTF